MILTGLAKEDFLSWYGTGEHYFTTTLKNIEQYANIIDWLDSVGIYINLGCITIDGIPEYDYCIQENNTLNGMNGHTFETRKQATEAAIKVANTIFNNKA